jgi:hypothetical protein
MLIQILIQHLILRLSHLQLMLVLILLQHLNQWRYHQLLIQTLSLLLDLKQILQWFLLGSMICMSMGTNMN